MFLHMLRGEGFADVASRPAGHGLPHVGFAAFGGDHDYRHALRVGHSRKLLDELQPVHYGHIDVAKNEIDDVSLEDAKSLGSVSGLQYLLEVNACLAQAALHDLAHDRGIVHDKSTYAIHEAAP